MPKIFVQAPNEFARKPFIQMFLTDKKYQPSSLKDADIVVFTGGADINPELYGEQLIKETHIDLKRDTEELRVYGLAKGKLLVGVCRGAQLLNVLGGGSLWQDVDGHRSSHFIEDLVMDRRIWVSSTHHQMMIPPEGSELLAKAVRSHKKKSFGRSWDHFIDHTANDDPEVVWIEKTNSLCFQPHPEHLGLPECRTYFFDLIDFYLEKITNEAA